MKYEWLIVGAGFTGCVLAERLASQMGQRVLLVDKRDHVGGNAYDHYDNNGILVHKYGPHIFHTNDARVWAYLSQFTEWRRYEHRVLALIDGKRVPVPFNLNSLQALFPARQAAKLEMLLIKTYGMATNVPILRMRQHSHPEIKSLSEYVYHKVFENYTLKQWGLTPEQLGPSVTGRVPVRVSHDDRYFQDTYQAMPKDGFTSLFRRMLSHSNIEVALNTDYAALPHGIRFDRMAYTGPIDAFFNYVHGELPYRSLRFEFEFSKVERMQPVAVVNYPNDHAYTRITEFKHITGQVSEGTTFVREYPQPHISGKNEPYYPLPLSVSADLYKRYVAEAAKLEGAVLFAGRLADYKYYNMDQATARALALFVKIAQPERVATMVS
jgi:UDP-galactopyranose mutase